MSAGRISVNTRMLGVGEEKLWNLCSLEGTYEEKSHQMNFTYSKDFRPEHYLIAERKGNCIGKLHIILEEPYHIIMVDPIIPGKQDLEEIAELLFNSAIEIGDRFGVKVYMVILQERLPYIRSLLRMMPKWGFIPIDIRRLYKRSVENLVEPHKLPQHNEISLLPSEGETDPSAIATLDQVLKEAIDTEEGETGSTLLSYFADRCRNEGTYYPEDWIIAKAGNNPVACVVPAIIYSKEETGSILYLGVIPAFRRRGIGTMLYGLALHKLKRRGVKSFIDSCDERNLAAIRIFEKCGFTLSDVQHRFKVSSQP